MQYSDVLQSPRGSRQGVLTFVLGVSLRPSGRWCLRLPREGDEEGKPVMSSTEFPPRVALRAAERLPAS